MEAKANLRMTSNADTLVHKLPSGRQTPASESLRHPRLQGEWDEHVDPESGYKYYINRKTGRSTWTQHIGEDGYRVQNNPMNQVRRTRLQP